MFVIDDRLVRAQNVETESGRWTVCVVQDTSEQFLSLLEGITCAPNHFRVLFIQSISLVLIVDATQEETIEAHLRQQRGLFLPKSTNYSKILLTKKQQKYLQILVNAQMDRFASQLSVVRIHRMYHLDFYL